MKSDTQKPIFTRHPHMESILENFGMVIFIFSVIKGKHKIEYISPSVSIFGYVPEDFVKNNELLTTFFHPDDYKSLKNQLGNAIKQKLSIVQKDYRIITKDNKIRWVHDETHLTYNSNGEVIGNETIMRDITREKEQQFEFQDLSKMNQNILEMMNDACALTNKDYKLIYVNPAFLKLIGVDSYELLHKNFGTLITPSQRKPIVEFLKNPNLKIMKNFECKIINSEQQELDVDISIQKLYSTMEEFIGLFIIINDISVLRKTRQDLLETQIRYWSLFESANEAFFVIKDNVIEECNKKAGELFRCSKEWLIGKNLWELAEDYNPNFSGSTNKFNQIFENLVEEDEIQFQYTFKRVDNTTFEADTKISHIKILNLPYIFCILNDNTFQKNLEIQLTQERNLLNTTLNNIHEAVISINSKGQILLFNPMAERITGYSKKEVIGKKLNDTIKFNDFHRSNISVSLFEEISKKFQQTKSKFFEENIIMVTKSHLHRKVSYHCTLMMDRNNNVQGYVFVFRDITVQEKIREERIKAQKMESIGLLAGGIAHDFNNILASILGNVSIAKLELESEDSEIYKLLDETEHAINRANQLTKQLLTFSKGGTPVKKVISIQNLIEETTKFVLRGSNIKYFYKCESDLWNVEVDEGQIGQCLQNIIINAKQAMPDGGNIVVEVANVKQSDRIPLLKPDVKYIVITIMDQGEGIPMEYQNRIFDPYFTTKESGTGLGLAVVYSIIKNHNGFITFDSKSGEGTIFYIYLPAFEGKKEEQPKAPKKTITPKTGRILVMDDEKAIRNILKKMLTRLGFQVDFTKEGRELLAFYKEQLKKQIFYDYLILDLTIPGGMGGKEAAEKILEINSNQKIVVASGYSNDPVMSDFRTYGFIDRLEKPFTIHELNKIFENDDKDE